MADLNSNINNYVLSIYFIIILVRTAEYNHLISTGLNHIISISYVV